MIKLKKIALLASAFLGVFFYASNQAYADVTRTISASTGSMFSSTGAPLYPSFFEASPGLSYSLGARTQFGTSSPYSYYQNFTVSGGFRGINYVDYSSGDDYYSALISATDNLVLGVNARTSNSTHSAWCTRP